MKFSDEELALIMDAHEMGRLVRGGMSTSQSERVCILQAAHGFEYNSFSTVLTYKYDGYVANWFDANYSRDWSTDEFLRQLEAQGWA